MRLFAIALAALGLSAAAEAATLTGSVSTSSASVNLASVGTLDWARWPDYSHKAAEISDVTTTGVLKTYTSDPRIIGDRSGIKLWGAGAAFELTVRATTSERTLTYYIGGWNTTGKVTATLPNAPAYTATFSSATSYSRVVTIRFRADADATLRVRFSLEAGAGTINMQAAALEGAAPAVAPPAAGSTLLTWIAPTQNEDGSALTDLAGYRVYWGAARGTYTQSARVDGAATRSYSVSNLGAGTWYFVVTALNAAGVESVRSNEFVKTIQ
jgi:hypothetical protein